MVTHIHSEAGSSTRANDFLTQLEDLDYYKLLLCKKHKTHNHARQMPIAIFQTHSRRPLRRAAPVVDGLRPLSGSFVARRTQGPLRWSAWADRGRTGAREREVGTGFDGRKPVFGGVQNRINKPVRGQSKDRFVITIYLEKGDDGSIVVVVAGCHCGCCPLMSLISSSLRRAVPAV